MANTAWYRKCTMCVHGNKPLDKYNKTCPVCMMGKSNRFKERKDGEWPLVTISSVGEPSKSVGVESAKKSNKQKPKRKKRKAPQKKIVRGQLLLI